MYSNISAIFRTCGRLKVAGRIVASGKEDVIVDTTLKRLVQRDRLSHELFLDPAKSVETRL